LLKERGVGGAHLEALCPFVIPQDGDPQPAPEAAAVDRRIPVDAWNKVEINGVDVQALLPRGFSDAPAALWVEAVMHQNNCGANGNVLQHSSDIRSDPFTAVVAVNQNESNVQPFDIRSFDHLREGSF